MRTTAIVTCIGLGFLVACGGETTPPATPAGGGAAEPATFSEQVAAGQKLYGEHCSTCHGAGGEGSGKAPRVVGIDKGALPLDPPGTAKARKVQFKTAADVAGFVVKNMPPGGPSLKEPEYWSILAFDLHANGVDLPNKLDGSNAKDVVLHK